MANFRCSGDSPMKPKFLTLTTHAQLQARGPSLQQRRQSIHSQWLAEVYRFERVNAVRSHASPVEKCARL